jgi:hypothetical protein
MRSGVGKATRASLPRRFGLVSRPTQLIRTLPVFCRARIGGCTLLSTIGGLALVRYAHVIWLDLRIVSLFLGAVRFVLWRLQSVCHWLA